MSVRPFPKVSIILLVAVFLVGCGKGVSNAPASAPDAPTVLMEVPPTDAIGTSR
jgi:PBP1b-binding outer membrane lipoprotein LpoB